MASKYEIKTDDERLHANDGLQLTASEIFAVVDYVAVWPQRQCMCIYKDFKNFERLNNVVQIILTVGIRQVFTLPEDIEREIKREQEAEAESAEGKNESEEEKKTDTCPEDFGVEISNINDKERLLNFMTKVFLMNFPSYIAYKHIVHSSLEELSQQETSALNNYCEISDPEVPLYLLRNVCFFCDSNGIASLNHCFEKATPETLPFNFAHILITIIANLRLWMNIPTVMQCIIPLRSAVIRYMCQLPDKDLRVAGNRNMTELLWAAVKDPIETHFTFDKEGLDLAFKYFTCSTLTLRLAGITQINNQINMYNESCNNENLADAEKIGSMLSQWLLENKIVDHIFGPNLHVELIKQSQIILNFLAVEGKITNEHLDSVWATSQLKHCGKQVYDILIPLIKNLELQPVQHLLKLVSSLEPSAHTESTLYLVSSLIKCVWNTFAVSQSYQVSTLPSSYSGPNKEEEMDTVGMGKPGNHEMSSSEHSQLSNREVSGDKEKAEAGSSKGEGELNQDADAQPSHRELESSVEAESDASHASEETQRSDMSETEEHETHCECHQKHCASDVQLHHSRSSESDLDCSDTGESEVSDYIAHKAQVMTKRHIKQNLTKAHNIPSALHHQRHHHHHHHRQHPHNMEVSSSEEEVEEEEEEEELDLEYMDSEDEEIIRQAHLVHMKHVCEKDSEESSELDDETHEKMLHEAKLQYEARQALQQHHQNQQHEQLIQQAAHLLLRQEQNHRRFEKKQRLKQQKSCIKNQDKDDDDHQKQLDTSGESSQLHLAELAHSSQDSHDSDAAVVSIPVQEMGLSDRALKHTQKVDDLHKETEIFDCTPYIKQMQSKKRREASEYMEDIMSPDDGSYHSSGISAKSEKNMADFEGEELLSDEEIAQINAHSHFNSKQMQQHLSSMASMYHTHLPRAVIHHRPSQKEAKLSTSEFTSEDVCRKGNTLLWDLVQEDCAQSLPDGLAVEAEKALCTLVCFSTEKKIKIKFIEACVENVANHRSVVISLRLLPRIFGSFQQYRSGTDTHTVTMWADKELHMMKHFFDDLIHYTENVKGHKQNPLYCHREEIQVRLQFLTCIFSSMGSPDSFRLSLEQVDVLWNCLANDDECSDECLNWFLNQAKSKDHHALGLEAFKHVFLEKMPQLHPKSMSMVGLNLFQQLSHLARIANASSEEPLSEDKVYGIDQMWNIALRSLNTDVSLNAIQYLNFYYINYGNGLLEKEKEFVQQCMDNLLSASTEIEKNSECQLLVIQRGLILLKTHLESFKKRYAYQLRNWQIEGKGIISHQRNQQEKQSQPIRVLLQPAGMPEKTPLEMLSTDLIAELRAEVARWWETLQKQQQEQTSQADGHGGAMLSPILGAMLGDGPIRMITLGQELSVDMDEKTLSEMQFKDMQLIFVSVGASRPPRKMDGTLPSSHLPTISPEKVPMMLLLQQPHFDHLFNLLEQLSNACFQMTEQDSQRLAEIQTKSRVLSRKVWELLMILPTNPEMLLGFKNILSKEENVEKKSTDWNKLLDSISPHRLMYSLQIVESLSRTPQYRRRSLMHSGGGDSIQSATEVDLLEGDSSPEEAWNKKFILSGGLKHMLDIFKSERLQNEEGKSWSQWNQECLAYLLRLISQFSVSHTTEPSQDDVFESIESPRKKIKRTKSSHEKILIPRLNQSTLDMLNPESELSVLMQILYNAAMPCDSNQVYTGSWGRAEVVHYAMSFLVSWAHSCETVQQSLCQRPTFSSWLKRLLLEAPEPHVRKEVCMGLYRLCLGKSSDSKIGYGFLMPLLSSMLSFLSDAMLVKPPKNSDLEVIKEKEPYGPGCKDYFWLACRFVESISKEDAKPDSGSLVNLDTLARELHDKIAKREFLETRLGGEEDSCLIGLLNLFTATIKYNPSFKVSREGQEFLEDVFQYLFALPSPNQRYLPKCKNHSSRSAAYDLLVEMVKGSVDNYFILLAKMLQQHTKDAHVPYPWDYWPHEDGRSKCGFVGLTNLGATCYMATCMQHLYMLPQVRESVLQAYVGEVPKVPMVDAKHEGTLSELQKMFAYLQESERKAYNPKSFCKVYTMDKQPLNTGEQKDMTEFFTDLITKMEEMSPAMKKLVKNQFGGIISNNVVSLDCPHVSRTVEEFYTVRCQVTDMKNLYESLDEVTVKDMLEGDNMYTCSNCQKKVRAEKRACFQKLPRILCFNTMRYTFNMVTMMKEKVNTHFSFPLLLDMTHYMEKHLMGPDKLQDDDLVSGEDTDDIYEYELIGVTVHTGTADGGHYYSFIRDRINHTENEQDKWYLFNDAEIKPFDCSQIALECFGGEMTSKTYDSVTDKFMDFSFEKTNSAYMLFYQRCLNKRKEEDLELSMSEGKFNFDLEEELAEWIWADNMQFLQDKNIFEHTYFGFMWQICAFIPQTLPKGENSLVPLKAAQLSTSFVLETLIHSKEKPTMLQWIELLTKLFNTCPQACEWFLDHMAETDWWPQQILIKCPNQMVRQMFHRLSIHVINQLRPDHVGRYLQPIIETEDGEVDTTEMGTKSCVTRFIRKLLSVLEHGVRPHSKYLTEYFAFLLDFAKMGDDECFFLIQINAISTMINFYMGQKSQENYVEILSDEDEEEEEVITLTDDAYKPLSLEKMIALIALLVEKARGEDNNLQLSERDYHAIIGGKGFPFLFNQLRDSINVRQSCNLIFSLSRWNDDLALAMVQMVFTAIKKLSLEQSQPFFKLLTMLLEFVGGPPGMPPFTQYVLQKFWELAKNCPQPCLEWLSTQVTRNKLASAWVLSQADNWVEQYLIMNNNSRVRNAAAYLLVSLVPSPHFRQSFRTTRILSPQKDIQISQEALSVLHQIYDHLLSLLPRTRLYVDPHTHGTMKLTCYFCLMTYCLISKTEKLMFSPHFLELWQVFQPKLSEPQISTHHNKQALLLFWYHVCLDFPENVKLIVNNPHVCKNIGFIYILADHEDQDVVMFNRCMLPSYYGLLRMCCQQSRSFTRQLAQHQNVQWAFKNISPYPAQYTAAVEELFRMMKLMATVYEDSTEDEIKAVNSFKRNTIQLYLNCLDARSMWQTLISALKILIESDQDRILLLYQQGLQMLTEAFHTLHVMYHEATACHVTGDIVDLLTLLQPTLKTARYVIEKKGSTASEIKNSLSNWKERMELVKKLLTLLNSYTPPEIRKVAIEVLREMLLLFQSECVSTMVPILVQSHMSFQETNMPIATGPYFPRRGQKPFGSKSNIRPPRPQFQMFLHSSQIEAGRGVDDNYDASLSDFFMQYHGLVDLICRVAANHQNLNEQVVNLSAMVAYEGVPLHIPYFAKLWYEIYQSEQVDKNCIRILCESSFFIDYVDAVLLDERSSLNNHVIYQFFCNYFPKVHQQVLNDQGRSLLDSLIASIVAERSALENVRFAKEMETVCQRLNGDLRAMLLIFSVQLPKQISPVLIDSLQFILEVCQQQQKEKAEVESEMQQQQLSQPTVEQEPASQTSAKTGSDDDSEDDKKGDQVPSKKRKLQAENEGDVSKTETEDEHNLPSSSSSSSSSEAKSETEPQPSTSQQSDTIIKSNRVSKTKDKNSAIDQVAKNIDCLFSLIMKK